MCFRGKLRGNRFGHYSKTELFKYKNYCKKVKVLYLRTNKALSLARKEGFEPSRRFYPAYSLSRGAPSASWVLPQVDGVYEKMAERVGFEPTETCASPVFKTGSFNRSDISPLRCRSVHHAGTFILYHKGIVFVKILFPK